MKKFRRTLSLILLFQLSLAVTLLSETFYIYTESGNMRSLTVQDSIVTVKPSGSFGTFSGLFVAEAALDDAYEPSLLSDGFYKLRVKDGYDAVDLVESLRDRGDVLFANLSFLDPMGSPIYLSETIAVNFFPNTSQAQIDSINNVHSVTIVDSFR